MINLLAKTFTTTMLLMYLTTNVNAESLVLSHEQQNIIDSTTIKVNSQGSFKRQINNTDVLVTKKRLNKDNSGYSGLTREEHLRLKSLSKVISNNVIESKEDNKSRYNLSVNARSNSFYHDSYSIYDAFSYLLTDVAYDGYYQSFSIIFDADYYPVASINYANVYAELYLSHNGGPWIHYYSTDIFTLYGQSEEDEFEVNTTLHQGFVSGEYDVLIDLYDADYDELVVSYNSDDNNALYALPLESEEYDHVYESEVVYSSGGSFSVIALVSLIFLLLHKISRPTFLRRSNNQ